jgi:hypothetical protein
MVFLQALKRWRARFIQKTGVIATPRPVANPEILQIFFRNQFSFRRSYYRFYIFWGGKAGDFAKMKQWPG